MTVEKKKLPNRNWIHTLRNFTIQLLDYTFSKYSMYWIDPFALGGLHGEMFKQLLIIIIRDYINAV